MKTKICFLLIIFSGHLLAQAESEYMYNYCQLKVAKSGKVQMDKTMWTKSTNKNGNDVYTPIKDRVSKDGKPILNPNGTPQFCEAIIEVAKNKDGSTEAVKIEYNRSGGRSSMYRFRDSAFAVYRDSETSGPPDPSKKWEIVGGANQQLCDCLYSNVPRSIINDEETQRIEANETPEEKQKRLQKSKEDWQKRVNTKSKSIEMCREKVDTYNSIMTEKNMSLFPEMLNKEMEIKSSEKLITEQDEFTLRDVCGRLYQYADFANPQSDIKDDEFTTDLKNNAEECSKKFLISIDKSKTIGEIARVLSKELINKPHNPDNVIDSCVIFATHSDDPSLKRRFLKEKINKPIQNEKSEGAGYQEGAISK